MAEKKPKNNLYAKDTLRLYWQATWKYKDLTLLSLGLPLGTLLLNVFAPFFGSKVLASLITNTHQTTQYFYGFIIVSMLGILFDRFGVAASMKQQANVMRDLHNMVMERLMQRSAGFYADRVGGKLVSDALDFINNYGSLMTNGYIKGMSFLLVILTGMTVLFFASWQLGIIVFAILLLLTISTVQDSKRRKSLRQARLETSKKLTGHLSDNLVNAITIKTFAREADELAEAKHIGNRLQQQRLSDWVRTTRNENSRLSILILVQIAIMFSLIRMTHGNPHVLSAGIFAFTYSITLLSRFFDINGLIRQVDEAVLNASPMTEILLQPIEIQDTADAKSLDVSKGEISLKDVSFAYPEGGKHSGERVFHDFSLQIHPGERVGLVGHSGGGKSTLTRLLLRFDDIQAGVIAIDGQDIKQVTQKSLRQAIAYVPQEPLLFHRTLRENIAYGNLEATMQEIREASRQANALEFIVKLPHGFDTVVGERGVKLSGGQRQRIAIARAILKNAPILVLDEATSALDSESEKAIQQALWELMKGKTAIVVAHRLSTIQRLDKIVVIDNGRIAEQGSHAELLKNDGLYAKLWKHQSGGFIDD